MNTSRLDLLRRWTDALTRLQVTSERRELDGGILCPACLNIHGRCADAVYPLIFMAKATGEARYLDAAKRLFDWGENMILTDGGMINDAKSEWRMITVFGAQSLLDALKSGGELLAPAEKARWEERLSGMAAWIYANLLESVGTNINYFASGALVMRELGDYLARPEYVERAAALAKYCEGFFSESLLLSGEGTPRDARTAKGCAPFDLGYNVEESLPALLEYALIAGDNRLYARAERSALAHLDFMLPDGGWDNSFGTRNYKWTYWGSRTSDGCLTLLAALSGAHPECGSALARHLSLLQSSTHDGLLFGGPHYVRHGEPACVHHTFCHAKSLAALIESGWDEESPAAALPSEIAPRLRRYPELDACRAHVGGFTATFASYDHSPDFGHAIGAGPTLLWHESLGPLIASGMREYYLKERGNMQAPRDVAAHASLTPRVEIGAYKSCDDAATALGASETDSGVEFVCSGRAPARWTLSAEALTVDVQCAAEDAGEARLLLPLISGCLLGDVERERPIFNLCPGFEAREYAVRPSPDGHIRATVRATK